MVQEEGSYDHKDRGEVAQEVGGWVQGAGVGPPGGKQTGSKIDEPRVPVVGTSSVEVVANRGT